VEFEDRTLTCKDCNAEFPFTAKEQEFYAQKGFINDPVRCYPCRQARKERAAARRSGGGGRGRRGERQMHDAVCTECGAQTQVPFRPTPGKSVLCRDCFRK
jgi:CxxC-x17-CxxC domain-containing protein